MIVQFIAITGGSGSGKSWLARRLKRRLGKRAGILALDDFYRDRSALPPRQRRAFNFDQPAAIDWPLFRRCLEAIRRGETVLLPRYDFATHARRSRPRIWHARPVVLLDGLWLLHRPALRRLYALSVFVDCPDDVRCERRLARDRRERGRSRASVLRQWRAHVQPMHERFVATQARRADVVLNAGLTRVAVAGLTAQIGRVLMDRTRP